MLNWLFRKPPKVNRRNRNMCPPRKQTELRSADNRRRRIHRCVSADSTIHPGKVCFRPASFRQLQARFADKKLRWQSLEIVSSGRWVARGNEDPGASDAQNVGTIRP